MESSTPTPNETISENHDLLWKLVNTFNEHVNALVEKKVNEIFTNHATLALVSEEMKAQLSVMVDEAINEHESDYDHPSNDEVSDQIATHVAHIDFTDNIRRSVEEIMSDGDYCTEERATELAEDAVNDIDFEEKVREALQEIITK